VIERLTDEGTDARETAPPAPQPLVNGAAESPGVSVAAQDVQRRAVTGALMIGARGVGVRVFGLAGNVVLARMLLGTVALALSLLTLGGVIFDGGLGAGLIRRLREPTTEELRNVAAVQLAGALALAAAVAAVGIWAGAAGEVAAVMMLALPIMALRGPSMVVLERRMSFGAVAAVEVGEVVAYYGWAVLTVALGFGVWGLATASIVKAVVGTLTLAKVAPGTFVRPAVSPELIRSLLRFGVRVQAAQVVRVVRDQALNLATFAIAGAATLGLWTLATRVLQIPLLLFESLWRVSFPAMSQLLAAGEDPKPLLERGVRSIAAATGLAATVLVCSAPALVPAVFGPEWTDAAVAVAASCLGLQIGGPVSAVAAGYLYASGEAGVVVRSAVAQALVWPAVALPLLPGLGVAALGIGYVGVGLVDAVILSRAAQRLAGARLVPPLMVPLAIAVLASVAGWAAISALRPTIAAAAAGALLGALLYAVGLLAVRRALLVELIALGRRVFASVAPGA
jgi:O-antigen/teichoic acid export membrane protein